MTKREDKRVMEVVPF